MRDRTEGGHAATRPMPRRGRPAGSAPRWRSAAAWVVFFGGKPTTRTASASPPRHHPGPVHATKLPTSGRVDEGGRGQPFARPWCLPVLPPSWGCVCRHARWALLCPDYRGGGTRRPAQSTAETSDRRPGVGGWCPAPSHSLRARADAGAGSLPANTTPARPPPTLASHSTGQRKNYGFVTFETEDALMRAVSERRRGGRGGGGRGERARKSGVARHTEERAAGGGRRLARPSEPGFLGSVPPHGLPTPVGGGTEASTMPARRAAGGGKGTPAAGRRGRLPPACPPPPPARARPSARSAPPPTRGQGRGRPCGAMNPG